MDASKPIEFSDHAREKMMDRGASESEIVKAIRAGSSEPARKGRTLFMKNFNFHHFWRGKYYGVKQVAPIVIDEPDRQVVVTVFVYYF